MYYPGVFCYFLKSVREIAYDCIGCCRTCCLCGACDAALSGVLSVGGEQAVSTQVVSTAGKKNVATGLIMVLIF